MTTEKAIEYWKARYENTKYFDDVHCDASELREHKEYVEALKETITALEKQVPKKIVRFNENFYTFYTCPDCMKYFNGMVKPRYCSGCGQALDWGDDHE